MPLRPAHSPAHVASVPIPSDDTNPIPVTTTRLLKPPPSSGCRPPCRPVTTGPRGPGSLLGLGVLLDVVHGLAHARDLLRVLVRDLDTELFLEGHDELHRIERVGPEIVHEGRVRRHFLF